MSSVNANNLSHSTFQSYVATDHVEKKISAEELVRFTKPITMATAKAVAAGNSCRQDEAIVAANTGRKAICDLLRACKVRSQSLLLVSFADVFIVVWTRWVPQADRHPEVYCSVARGQQRERRRPRLNIRCLKPGASQP